MASIFLGRRSFFITNLLARVVKIRPAFGKTEQTFRPGLPFRDDRHRSALQKGGDECTTYLQAAVMADEAPPP